MTSSHESGLLPRAVVEKFAVRYGEMPAVVVRAPGRVNLIGEHTDYNGGFVLPMAIEHSAWIALRPRPDSTVRVHSLEYDEESSFAVSTPEHTGSEWSEYLKGVAWAFGEAGVSRHGWEGVMGGDVPIGAGLSSSAALELATARAFVALDGGAWDPARMACLCQRAENGWVGVQCGIMDQMISAVGREGHAVLIDCRSLETQAVPLPENTTIVIMDTATRRGLLDSAYNERRRECEEAASFFGVPFLRDVTPELLALRGGRLDPVTARRARHVVTENARTLAAAAAMRSGDAVRLGELMNESHESLRADFEVSSPALDTMVEIARTRTGCLGARMTGAGFGGCAVALVTDEAADEFVRGVEREYRNATNLAPRLYRTRASRGASVEPPAPFRGALHSRTPSTSP